MPVKKQPKHPVQYGYVVCETNGDVPSQTLSISLDDLKEEAENEYSELWDALERHDEIYIIETRVIGKLSKTKIAVTLFNEEPTKL